LLLIPEEDHWVIAQVGIFSAKKQMFAQRNTYHPFLLGHPEKGSTGEGEKMNVNQF
jgi:hypothetical protein